LLVPYIAQGVAMLARGDATAEDIDTAMRLGAGYPMGPITLSDYVGNDINLAVMEGWNEAHPENPAFVNPEALELLGKMVKEGKLGRKTGQGFYKWNGNKRA
jgi:3-hydroxyacyl-CoA dehydrogenase